MKCLKNGLVCEKILFLKKHYEVSKFSYNAHIKDIIGNIKIKQVKLKDIQNIVNKMIDQGKSPRTTKTIKDILSPVFEFAIKNDYIEKNIAREIEIQKFDNKRYFTIDDEDRNALYEVL
ncbi:phage integrase central domain-containing protein [Campylobacter insulaenigrae]|uniref:phage integrase central domain-containing protein n=1 Tax=Campylobacter insulaenigrae TaxID=260714 RepID=UPI00356B647C